MQRFRVECNFGSKYFDDIFNARRYFYKCIERDLQVELWKVTYHHCAAKKEYSANSVTAEWWKRVRKLPLPPQQKSRVTNL